MKEVYLDNSATTMAYRSVGELVQKVMCEDYGNPSSMPVSYTHLTLPTNREV